MTAPDQRLDFALPKHATVQARQGLDVLRRIRDSILEAYARFGVKPRVVMITKDTRAKILAFWLGHFPETPDRDLPLGLYNIPFVVGMLGPDEIYSLGFSKRDVNPPTQH